MIEIRWKMKKGTTTEEPKLQYRVLKTRIDAGGALNVFPAPVEWSNWIDVPFVVPPKKQTP